MDEFTIKDLLGILWKRAIWIVLAAFLFGAVVGGYYYGFVEDEYAAKAVLYVLQTYQDGTEQLRVDTNASTFFAADYKVLIQTVDILEKVAAEVGLSNVNALNNAAKIDINAVSGTRVLHVIVKGKDPRLCMNVANAASRVFSESVQEITKTDALALVSEARLPTGPSGPSRMTNTLLAMILGGALCYALFVVKDMLNTRVVTDDQIEKTLQQPLLATVRDYRKEIDHYLAKAGSKTNNLFQFVPIQTQESIRTLSMNIKFLEREIPLRTLTFTSVTPKEGKSTLSLMVAQNMAQEGLNVLIVDMDFRNPSIGKFLKRRHTKDLVDYMMGDAPLSAVVAATDIPNLSYVDSTHKSISLSRVVRSAAFDVFLNNVRNLFDLVIFDTPPLGLFIDAAILAAKLDGTVMVIAQDHDEIKHASSVIEQLKKGNANILGVALNFVAPQEMVGYYKYGQYGNYRKYAPYYGDSHDARKKKGLRARADHLSKKDL